MHGFALPKRNAVKKHTAKHLYWPMPPGSGNRERLLRAVNSTASLLFSREICGFEKAITEALKTLGCSIHAGRAAIWKTYTKDACVYVSRVGAWDTSEKPKTKEDPVPGDLLIDTILPDWEVMLVKQAPFYSFDKDLLEPFRSIARKNDIRSILILPVNAKGNYWGFITFCSYENRRIYFSAEKELLRSGGNLIASAIDYNEKNP